ncbi:hypothetical protein K491DRAFT_112593 [Lophiostoma macrostomum CBS 122681]|uniref:Uncharacterized protein n=1 Tax=Lophiostoma macrostomum CBS 122681 TaxID=1314788 RepID=A0A6A6ST66_9PLEO|nr:hypothetical protein K491DRAFT_112593 [Lophiostoma macrostomum CBS 122681]
MSPARSLGWRWPCCLVRAVLSDSEWGTTRYGIEVVELQHRGASAGLAQTIGPGQRWRWRPLPCAATAASCNHVPKHERLATSSSSRRRPSIAASSNADADGESRSSNSARLAWTRWAAPRDWAGLGCSSGGAWCSVSDGMRPLSSLRLAFQDVALSAFPLPSVCRPGAYARAHTHIARHPLAQHVYALRCSPQLLLPLLLLLLLCLPIASAPSPDLALLAASTRLRHANRLPPA